MRLQGEDPDVHGHRATAVREYTDAIELAQQANQAPHVLPWWREWFASRSRAREQLYGDRDRAFERAVQAVRESGLGAEPRTWGVLSGGIYGSGAGGQWTLEATLRRLIADHHDERPQWCAALDEAHGRVFAARVAAGVHRDRAPVDALTATITDLARQDPEHPSWLVEHLPGELRPLPASLEHMQRYNWRYMVTRALTPDITGKPRVKINDLVVYPPWRGSGLGTALLVHLCRYADAHGLTLHGDIGAGSDSDEHKENLRVWYRRHGFTCDKLHLHREPAT